MDLARQYIKSAIAFVLALATNLLVTLQTTGTPIPRDALGWLLLILSTVLITAGVAVPRNKQTPATISTAIDKGDVSHAEVKQVLNRRGETLA